MNSSPSLIGVRTPVGIFWPLMKVPFMVPISSATNGLPSFITKRAWRREMLRAESSLVRSTSGDWPVTES